MVGLSNSIGIDITGRKAGVANVFESARLAFALIDYGFGASHAVRVRRDGVSPATQDFTFNEVNDGTLASWVGAGNNGFVTIWYNQLGVNNLEQAIQTQQPKIVDTGSLILVNGNASLEFDGVDDFMQIASFTTSQFSQFYTYGNYTSNTVVGFSGAVRLTESDYATTGGTLSTNIAGTKLVEIDNINFESYVGGVLTDTAVSLTQTFNRFIIGSINGTTQFGSFQICNYVDFDFANDQSGNRAILTDDLKSKYSIP